MRRLTRREWLRWTAGGGGLLAATVSGRGWLSATPSAPRTLDPARLRRFVAPLPRPPVAKPFAVQGAARYRITMEAAECQLHPDLPPTQCWTYNRSLPGPTIEARCGEPFAVEWVNALPGRHFLPIDPRLHGAGPGVPEVRAVVHLHGGRVPADSDGYPEAWYTPGQSRICRYPNRQDAALLYYHDHAMGISRLNVYAGLFGLYILRDPAEEELGLPANEFEIPLVLCDRWLTPRGQLYYPSSSQPGQIWVPEVFGNLVLVNGMIFPFADLEPRSYRFRVVNAANGRFFRLALSNGQRLSVVAGDQGRLSGPATIDELQLAPGERADLLLDFSASAGESLRLNDGVNDLVEFRIRGHRHALPAPTPPPQPEAAVRRLSEAGAHRTRWLTLREYDNRGAYPMLMLLDGRTWHEPVSENPSLGSIEIWELANLTDDTHPIHLHQVRFQVLDRRAFAVDEYLAGAGVRWLAPPRPPAPEEQGWKDTVRAYPGDVTRIIIPFESYPGRYVWHCHILEHAANEMMRPLEILAGPAAPRA